MKCGWCNCEHYLDRYFTEVAQKEKRSAQTPPWSGVHLLVLNMGSPPGLDFRASWSELPYFIGNLVHISWAWSSLTSDSSHGARGYIQEALSHRAQAWLQRWHTALYWVWIGQVFYRWSCCSREGVGGCCLVSELWGAASLSTTGRRGVWVTSARHKPLLCCLHTGVVSSVLFCFLSKHLKNWFLPLLQSCFILESFKT